MKTYSELMKMNSFEERFKYLKLDSSVGAETFGSDRYLNQILYKSPKWRSIRDQVFIRDNGCDLGDCDHKIFGRFIIHHMNPISIDDINNRNPKIFDPEFLITTTHETHNALHYGDESILDKHSFVERKPGDTKLW